MKKNLYKIGLGLIALVGLVFLALPAQTQRAAADTVINFWSNRGTYIIPSPNKDLGASSNKIPNGYFSNINVSGSCTGCVGSASSTKINGLTGTTYTFATTTDTNITISIATTTGPTMTWIPGFTGQLSVARGGTGAAALTSGALLFGNGAGAIATSSNLTFTAAAGLTVGATSTLATTTVAKLSVTQAPTFSSISGSTQCLHVNTSGVVSGTGSDCGSGGGGGGVSSVDMTVPTGLAITGNPITTSGTLALSLQSGYNIPLTASTTNWNNFFNTPSGQITAGTGLSWSGNTLNATGGGSTGTSTYITVCSSGCTYTATGTNDNIGINQAIAAANAAGGGTVLVKAGTYHLAASSGQIKMRDINNVTLAGEGNGTQIFIGGGLGIEVATSTGIQIRDLYIDGGGQSSASFNADQAIRIYNSHNVKVNNNTITNSNGFGMFIANDGRQGIGASTTSEITILNNTMSCNGKQDCIGGGKNNTGDGSLNTADVNITGNQIIQNTYAGGVINSNMDINCIDMVAVVRVNFESNHCKGDVVFGNEKYPNTKSKISNNIIEPPLGSVTVSGEIVLEEGCNDCTVTTNATGTPEGDLVTGNIITAGGIYIAGDGNNPYNHLLVTGNTIKTATSSAQHFRIAEHGIQASNIINSKITNNIITAFTSGQATKGVFLQSTTNTDVSFNTFDGFATGTDLASQSSNTETANIFKNVTTTRVNPGTIVATEGGNVALSNNTGFYLASASSTAIVAQGLATMNSSNDIFVLANAGDATHPASHVYFGYNSPMAWTFGGSCCGGAIPTAFNFNSSGTNTWSVNSTNVLQITSAGILLPQQSASQLLGTDGSKNVISYSIPLTVANGGTGATALTSGDILYGNGTSAIATSSTFTYSVGAGLTVSNVSTLATTTITNLTVQPATDSTSVFTVKNAAGSVGLQVDTTSAVPCIQLGTTGACTANLQVWGTSASSTLPLLSIASSTGSTLLQLNANGQMVIGGLTIGSSTAPSIATSTGAGSAGTASITGSNVYGEITVNALTSPTLGATIVTLTPTVSAPNKIICTVTPSEANAQALSGTTQVRATSTATTFGLVAGTAALTTGTTYKWFYACGGY